MVNQSHQLPQVGLAPQVNHSSERGMIMLQVADLNELDLTTKVIDHFLITRRAPPLDRDVVLAPGHDNPERCVLSCLFVYLRVPGLLKVREMDVAFEGRRLDLELKVSIQELDEAVQAMIGRLIGLVNQRIMALDYFNLAIVLVEWSQVRVVFPELRAGGADIRQETVRITFMEVAHGRRQHDNITRGKKMFENQLSHRRSLVEPSWALLRAAT